MQVISSPTKKGAVGALTSGTDVERGILGEDLLTSGVVALIRLQEICGSIRRAKISPFDNRLNQTDATINGVIVRVVRFGKFYTNKSNNDVDPESAHPITFSPELENQTR